MPKRGGLGYGRMVRNLGPSVGPGARTIHHIDPEVVDPEDVEMLQDLVLAAVNEALESSRNLASERMSALTGGLNIPGLL